MDAAPILQTILARLPADAGGRALALALTTAGAGLVLSFIGARVSRSIFTLVGVAAGALVGLHLPRWMGWEIDAMAVSIGAALVLGLAGYLFHMIWVGMTLGTLLATAGVLIAWHRLAADVTWTIPALNQLRDNWHTLPNGLDRVIPMVAAICFGTGSLMALFLPKLARVLTFSLLSTLLLTAGGIAAVAMTRPEWLARLPQSTQTQGMALAITVMITAVMQWALMPRMRKPSTKVNLNSPKPSPVRVPRDVRDLGSTPLGPLKPKEVRA